MHDFTSERVHSRLRRGRLQGHLKTGIQGLYRGTMTAHLGAHLEETYVARIVFRDLLRTSIIGEVAILDRVFLASQGSLTIKPTVSAYGHTLGR